MPANDCATVQRTHESVHKSDGRLRSSTAVVKHKEKEQADGLEIAESFILCTVSRAEAIYHAITGSGAEKSVNFLDVG